VSITAVRYVNKTFIHFYVNLYVTLHNYVCCAFYTQTVNLNHTVKITVVWDIMAYIVIIVVGGVMFVYLRGC
jgi:hypothetical protein